jgi:carbon monoxide dehydrogenase subunit G
MIIEGKFSVPASRDRVWESLWDIGTIVSWVPGCTKAEKIGETTYKVHLEQQVSFFKASFDLFLRVVEREPPKRITICAEGEDKRITSNIRIESEISLEPIGVDSTEICYRHDISVFGRLGALGFPIIKRKAQEAEAEFARRAAQSLSGGV